MASVKDNTVERFRTLFAIYDISGGYRQQQVWLSQISDYLKYDVSKEDDLYGICLYLKKEGLIEFKYLGPGILITNYGIKEIEESIVNPNNNTINFPPQIIKNVLINDILVDNVHVIRRARREFLQELYTITNANESIMINSFEVAKKIGMDEPTMNKVYWYLLDDGLIEFRYNGGGISITHLGIKTVEATKNQQNQVKVDDFVSTVGIEESPGYRNDLPQEVNRLLELPIEELKNEDESAYLEFKSSLCWDYDNNISASKELQLEYIKAIPAFMNSHGGILVVGIDKDNNKVLGLSKDFSTIGNHGNFDRWRLLLSDILYKRHKIEPRFNDYVEVSKRSLMNEHLAVIVVKKSPDQVWLSHNKRDFFFIRNDNRTISLEGRQLGSYIEGHFG